ncbi:DUF3348 family protein [Variovorax sp. HJSM1_2]|uniref:DUF3348 family protein n=1 Tax=Variovorax sp. HJSM1_2 TaxID=3366263 RepID=UPI003BC0B4C5
MNFSSSKLVRLLEHVAPGGSEASRQDSAERLSQWVGVFDAVKLHALHQSLKTLGQTPGHEAPSAGRTAQTRSLSLRQQFDQVRATLLSSITAPHVAADLAASPRAPRLASFQKEAAAAMAAPQPVVDFALHRQRYLDQQRKMELMIGPLRAHAQQTLSAASSALRQLAALDAMWQQMLEVREQKLLANLPAMLKQRFEQLRKTNADAASPASWVESFEAELQEVLLAELDTRLQPVLGLIEAYEASPQEG